FRGQRRTGQHPAGRYLASLPIARSCTQELSAARRELFQSPQSHRTLAAQSPMDLDINLLTVASARNAVDQRQVTATALAKSFYAKISTEDKQVNAYLTLSKDRALAQAAKIDALADKGEPLPPLAGVPVGIKDVMVTNGVRSTAGSKILENYIPPYDCTAVARLEAAGAVILGKLNCD